MDFELGIADRVNLLGVLPPEEVETNFLTLKSLRLFREELAIAKEEAEEIGLKTLEGGRIEWLTPKEKPKTFSIDANILKVIQRRLKGLDMAGKLKEQIMPVYEKFVLTDEPSE